MTKQDLEKLEPGDEVFYAGQFYEVAEIDVSPLGKMIGIYDELTSKHIDYLNPDSIDRVRFKNEKVCIPSTKQIFYVLFNKKHKDFFQSNTTTHTFSAPLLLDALHFKNKELAKNYITDHKLKGFVVVKVVPQYFFE